MAPFANSVRIRRLIKKSMDGTRVGRRKLPTRVLWICLCAHSVSSLEEYSFAKKIPSTVLEAGTIPDETSTTVRQEYAH